MEDLKYLIKVLDKNATVKIYTCGKDVFKKKVSELTNCKEDYMNFEIRDFYVNTNNELVVLL